MGKFVRHLITLTADNITWHTVKHSRENARATEVTNIYVVILYNNITTHNINTPSLYPICIISTSPISAATILVSPSSNYSIISTPTISTSVTTPPPPEQYYQTPSPNLFAHNIIIITQSLSQQYHHLHHQSLPPPPPSQYIIISQSLPRSIISTSPNQHALTISPSPNLYCIHSITTNLISTPTISVHDPISAPIISISPIYTPQYSTVPQSLHHKLIISTFPNLCPHKITIPNLTPIISSIDIPNFRPHNTQHDHHARHPQSLPLQYHHSPSPNLYPNIINIT